MNCLKIRNIYLIFNHDIKLERVTERGHLKLYPSEVIDVSLGRSKNQFIHSISPSINNELDETSLP